MWPWISDICFRVTRFLKWIHKVAEEGNCQKVTIDCPNSSTNFDISESYEESESESTNSRESKSLNDFESSEESKSFDESKSFEEYADYDNFPILWKLSS